jgi:hypothetical protein
MGTISDLAAPEPIDQPMTSPGELKYWVKFGEPEYDANAAGPFRGAQIWGRYIRIDEEE